MYGTEIVKDGAIVASSKNLRGILDYARKSRVVFVSAAPCEKNAHNGRLFVRFEDGAEGRAFFACYTVLLEWIGNRRSWAYGVRFEVMAPHKSTISRRSDEALQRLKRLRWVDVTL